MSEPVDELDVLVTIRQLVDYLGPDVPYKTAAKWVERGRLARVGRDRRGRVLVRLRDALEVERETWQQPRGRPRCTPSGDLSDTVDHVGDV